METIENKALDRICRKGLTISINNAKKCYHAYKKRKLKSSSIKCYAGHSLVFADGKYLAAYRSDRGFGCLKINKMNEAFFITKMYNKALQGTPTADAPELIRYAL